MKQSPQHRLLLVAGIALALGLGVTGCHRHKHAPPDLAESQEPDKILYEKSLEDIENHRFDVARLTLQTLLNTYPDSDYLADAKLAIADSYYQEGTRTSLTHAEIEYKDFITFFPNAPETAFAQYRAALCNFRRLEKADRDPTYARRAERELQILLLDYGDSEYAADAEKKLIQVQEVLAHRLFQVGRFYIIRGSWRAAASRLMELVERYPNYSQRDEALWMLARVHEEETTYLWERNPEAAARYYARLIREHGLSNYVPQAQEALSRLGKPIPEPDPVLMARTQNAEPILTEEERPGLIGRTLGIFSGRPDTSNAAARLGPPPLEPPAEKPQLPPPPFRSGVGSTIAAQTVEDLPEGAVIQSGQGEGESQGEKPQAEGEQKGKEQAGQKPPKRKKSIWRKLIPW